MFSSYLGINNKNKSAAPAENHIRIEVWIKEIYLAGKVPYLELHEAGVIHVVFDYFIRTFQEESFVRGHFVEYYFLNRRFTWPVWRKKLKMKLKEPWRDLILNEYWRASNLLSPIKRIRGFWSETSPSPSKTPYPKSFGNDPACPSKAPWSSSSGYDYVQSM